MAAFVMAHIGLVGRCGVPHDGNDAFRAFNSFPFRVHQRFIIAGGLARKDSRFIGRSAAEALDEPGHTELDPRHFRCADEGFDKVILLSHQAEIQGDAGGGNRIHLILIGSGYLREGILIHYTIQLHGISGGHCIRALEYGNWNRSKVGIGIQGSGPGCRRGANLTLSNLVFIQVKLIQERIVVDCRCFADGYAVGIQAFIHGREHNLIRHDGMSHAKPVIHQLCFKVQGAALGRCQVLGDGQRSTGASNGVNAELPGPGSDGGDIHTVHLPHHVCQKAVRVGLRPAAIRCGRCHYRLKDGGCHAAVGLILVQGGIIDLCHRAAGGQATQ